MVIPRSGLGIAVTGTPAAIRRETPPLHPELSAKAPWTRATVGPGVAPAVASVMSISLRTVEGSAGSGAGCCSCAPPLPEFRLANPAASAGAHEETVVATAGRCIGHLTPAGTRTGSCLRVGRPERPSAQDRGHEEAGQHRQDRQGEPRTGTDRSPGRPAALRGGLIVEGERRLGPGVVPIERGDELGPV